MIDVKLTQDAEGGFSFGIENGDLTLEDGFDTAILVSLMSDARAESDRVINPEFRIGWVGDLVSPVENRLFGSWLWLTDQNRLTTDTLNQAINFAQLSLNWFVDDGIAKNIVVTGEIVPRSGISLTIIITSITGKTTNHYVNLWELTGNAT